MRKNFLYLCCGIIFLSFVSPSRADYIDGYITPSFNYNASLGSITDPPEVAAGSGMLLKLDFGRLSRNVSIDLRMGIFDGYKSYGGSFRVFYHWSNFAPHGISAGGGVGGMYTPSSGTLITRGYTNPFASVFARYIYDFDIGIGVSAEVEVNFAPNSKYSGSDAPSDPSTLRKNFVAGISIFFEA